MSHNLIAAGVLCVGVLLILLYLIGRTASHKSRVNIDDLFLGEDGTMSRGAFVLLGSFAITSWIMVHLALTDKLTEGYLIIYTGVYAVPAVTKLITQAVVTVKGASPVSTSTTTIQSSTTVAP